MDMTTMTSIAIATALVALGVVVVLAALVGVRMVAARDHRPPRATAAPVDGPGATPTDESVLQ